MTRYAAGRVRPMLVLLVVSVALMVVGVVRCSVELTPADGPGSEERVEGRAGRAEGE